MAEQQNIPDLVTALRQLEASIVEKYRKPAKPIESPGDSGTEKPPAEAAPPVIAETTRGATGYAKKTGGRPRKPRSQKSAVKAKTKIVSPEPAAAKPEQAQGVAEEAEKAGAAAQEGGEVEGAARGEYKQGDFVMLLDDKGDLVSDEAVQIVRVEQEGDLVKYYVEGRGYPVTEHNLERPTADRLNEARALEQRKRVAIEATSNRPEAEPQKISRVVAEEIKKSLEEQIAALPPEDRARFEAIVNNRNLLDKTIGRAVDFAREKLAGKKLWGVPLDFTSSFLGTMGARIMLRKSIRSVISLSGWQMGAAVGGAFRGLREWRQGVREQYSAASWAEELEGKEGLDLANAHTALRQAIEEAKVKGHQEEALGLVLKLRDIETKLRSAGLVREAASPASALHEVLGIRQDMQAGGTDLGEERGKLYKDMLNRRRRAVAWKVAKGALVGAAIGAGAGYLGELAGKALAEHFDWGRPSVEGGAGVSAQLARDSREHLVELQKLAMREAIQKGAMELPLHEFSISAQAGEGLTNIARDFLHDYLAQQHELNPGMHWEFSREQLIYAEDFLRRQLEDHVQTGNLYQLKGEQIAEALARAHELSPEELANLKANWIGKVSEASWQKILDYGHLVNPGNNFAETVHQHALSAAAVVEHAPAGAVGHVLHNVAQGAESESTTRKIVYGVLKGVGVAAAGGLAYSIYRRARKTSPTPDEALADKIEAVEDRGAAVQSASSDVPEHAAAAGAEQHAAEATGPESAPGSDWKNWVSKQNKALQKDLRGKFGVEIDVNPNSNPDAVYRGLVNLRNGLAESSQNEIRGTHFRLGAETKVSDDGVINLGRDFGSLELIPLLSESKQALQAGVKLESLRSELSAIGIETKTNLTREKLLAGLQSLWEALRGLPPDKIRGLKLYFQEHDNDSVPEGLGIVYNMKADSMRAAISDHLKLNPGN